MTKKGNLFLLIKSLSKAEKRYFKLFCSTGEANTNYLQLFNAIDKQKEYDEKEIRRIFKENSFVTQLHVTKIYLTGLVLKALRNYHAKDSINSQLLGLLGDIEVLFNKTLYDLCYSKIQKAEELAIKYEKLPLLIEVLSWKRKLMLTRSGPLKGILNDVISDEEKNINKLLRLNSYWNYTINFFDFSHEQKLLRNTLFKDPGNADTLQSKILYFHTLYVYHVVNNDVKKAAEYITGLIELLEKNPERIQDDPHSYITALSNKIGVMLNNKEWDEIPSLISKMQAVPVKYNLPDENKYNLRLKLRMFNVELEAYRDTRQLEKGIELILRIQSYIKKFNKSVPQDYFILFYYQFAYIFFLKKDFHESLKWLNEIINTNFGKTREDIQIYSRILNLVIHFELNNIIVLRYSVHSCRRFLQKKKRMLPFNKVVLKLFSQLSLSLPEKYPVHFQKAYDELFVKNSSKTSEQFLDYIDLKSWIEKMLKPSGN